MSIPSNMSSKRYLLHQEHPSSDIFRIFTNVYGSVIDPKNFDPKGLVEVKSDVCVIPPNSFVLALSVEWFRIPNNVLTICVGKSTYARCGIIVNVTPFEPGWEGKAVLEISNTTPLPAKVYAGEGLAQELFFESDVPCKTSYADRKGRYRQIKYTQLNSDVFTGTVTVDWNQMRNEYEHSKKVAGCVEASLYEVALTLRHFERLVPFPFSEFRVLHIL